ncbi:uncharacterized protein EV422DRAFT_137805 [Fimicolochytrium jonesii]|uniref:uncharacterized protein n=1 Tax=Fimicolochytrium jonesii TaxID=1396493 RepID=UPI0022FE264E|nr:uncharacterized protein EV422DRAFT_137805 [Fimicolochytrium jonesii]KAI8825714.1 hypothetical protein EV422DRAFT_137805 [Fimicolochytrium jonesii]
MAALAEATPPFSVDGNTGGSIEPGKVYVKAIWDYEAVEDNELQLKAGDVVEVVELCNNDWYEGKVIASEGRQGPDILGFFPATRVAFLETYPQTLLDTLKPNEDEHVPAAGSPHKKSPTAATPQIAGPSPAAAKKASESSGAVETGAPATLVQTEPSTTKRDADAKPTNELDAKGDSVWLPVTSSDGRRYFWNSLTGESRWRPVEGEAPAPAAHKDEDLTKDWPTETRDSLLDTEIEALPTPLTTAPYILHEEPEDGGNGDTSARNAMSSPDSPSKAPPPPPPPPPVMNFPATPVDSSSDPELLSLAKLEGVPPEIIRREGYLFTKLKKQAPSKNSLKKTGGSWTQHWAILCVGFLFLFKDQAGKTTQRKPLHIIKIDYVTVEEVGKELTKKKGAFSVATENGAVWLINPSRDGEMHEWMDAITEASRERSTAAEYENSRSKLLQRSEANLPRSNSKGNIPRSGSGEGLSRSSTLLGEKESSAPGTPRGKSEKVPHSRRSTKTLDPDEVPYEGRKNNVKSKIGAFLFKRPSVDKLKEKGIILDESEDIFGGNLASQVKDSGKLVPTVVELCVAEVDKRGLTSQGIYRLSGNASTVQKIRQLFNAHEPTNLDDDGLDINAIASALKLYFRELKDPLIPYAFFDGIITAAKIQDYDTRLIELKTIIQSLPRPNYDTLEFMLRHLSRVTAHSGENKMEASNIAIVFGPTLIRPKEDATSSGYADILNMTWQNTVVESILVQVDWVFDGKAD